MESMKEDNTNVESGLEPSSEKLTDSGTEHSVKEGGEAGPPMSAKPSLMKIFHMAGPELPMLVFAIVIMIAAESTNLILPLIIANAYDILIDTSIESSDERMSEINHFMGLALIVYGAGTVLGYVRAALLGIIGERMVARLRYQLYNSILKQEMAFFDEHKSGELVSRLGSDTTLLQQVIGMSVPEALIGLIKGVVSVGLMFYINPKLAGLSFGSFIVLFGVAMPLGKLLGRLSKRYQDVLGEAQTHSTEAFGSMRTVQSFAAEEKELKRFGDNIGDPDIFPFWWPKKEYGESTYRLGVFKTLTAAGFFVFIFGFGFGFMYCSLWYGFYLVNAGEMTLGDLTAFQSYIFTIGFGVGGAASHITKIFEGVGASGRIVFLLERVPAIPKAGHSMLVDDDGDTPSCQKKEPPYVEAPAKTIKPNAMVGNVEFRKVSFAYPSRPDIKVLDDFTLNITADTTTALVGSSGAGKSTVVALMQRFYDIDSGDILVDGINLEDLDLKWLRKQIGYVQQEPQLFGLTVRENLLYGVDKDRQVSQEELEKACHDANAHDFITSWPNGYETLVGERGVKLSGGQKQRVAIARALLTNCRILLLDEATSALDAESEHLVQEAIDKAVVGRTVIVVAHRLSTIKQADQIVVMSDHKIVDVGTHDVLLDRCGKYKDLIKRQSVIAPPKL